MARKRVINKAKGNILFLAGAAIVAFFVFVAVFAPLIATHEPAHIDFSSVLLPPSSEYYFGTDELGRDIFSRVVYGTRISLFVGFVAVGISVMIGTVLGLISGYFGGFTDMIVMRFVDIMLCFPSFFLILAVIVLMLLFFSASCELLNPVEKDETGQVVEEAEESPAGESIDEEKKDVKITL